jgi:hypothetical protein
MEGERAQMVFTDPPWNIAIEDNVSGLGAVSRMSLLRGGLDARQGLPPWAVKAISRSQWNDGFGADSGPDRGGQCRGAVRPKAKFLG